MLVVAACDAYDELYPRAGLVSSAWSAGMETWTTELELNSRVATTGE